MTTKLTGAVFLNMRLEVRRDDDANFALLFFMTHRVFCFHGRCFFVFYRVSLFLGFGLALTVSEQYVLCQSGW